MKFNKNEFGWKEKVSVNTNLNNGILNIKFLPDMNTNSNMYIVNIIDLEEKTTYRVNTNINKNVLVLRYIFSDGTLKNLYSLNGKYILGKVEIYIYRKTDTLIEFDVNNIRHTCNIDEVNKTVEITKKALILNTDNAQEYTPTKDYHPATKKYVDSKFVMYESIETIYTIPMSEMQKCNNGTGRYISNIDFDELFINHEKYIYYANYKDDTLIQVTYDSKYNRFTTGVLDKTSDYNIILGFDLGTHRMYPFNSGSPGVKAYQFTNDLIIKRVPILNVNEVATKKYVDDAIENIETSGGSNINDTTASATTTYSSNKIETIIGSATLNTSAQDLKGAINEVFQNVSNGKQLIATAITDKGVATSSNSTFQTMADNIKNISSANINVEGFTEYTLFETDEVIPDTWIGANGGKNLVLSSDDFLNTFYDNLITNNSDYGTITKTALGKDESQTYTIYEYDFKPNNWNRMILLSSGMHPYELPAPFGLAYFMKYVMTSDDVAMKYIRENVRIKVIPIINPWGWNQNPRKYGTVNGVNINRNFDPMGLWERYNGNTTEWNQKGASAYSENETKILRNWLSRNKGAEFYIDCHTGFNAFATDVTNALYYLSDSPIKTQIESALTKLNNWITSKFGVTGKANSNRAQNPTGVFDYGVTDYAEKELGIPAFTIEQRPESTVFGTTAVNEGADIKHYMTSISTYVMELLLKQPEHITQSAVIQMKQSIIELNKDEANYITLEDSTTPIEPTEPIEPIQLEKFNFNLSNINGGDTSITDSINNKTLDIVGTDWIKNDDGSITFGANSCLRYDGGLCTENNKSFTVVLDMSANLSTSGTKYAMLWGDFNSDTDGIFFMCDATNFYLKDFSKGAEGQVVYAGALARNKYILIYNGSQFILRTKTNILGVGSLINLTIPALNKVYFGNTNTLSKNMDCKLYEIKWYNKALSDEEIQAL